MDDECALPSSQSLFPCLFHKAWVGLFQNLGQSWTHNKRIYYVLLSSLIVVCMAFQLLLLGRLIEANGRPVLQSSS